MAKILQYHPTPCVRTWKQAMVLNELGHEVYLGQMTDMLSVHWSLPLDCYKEVFTLSSSVGLSLVAPYFEIIHCHNEPDYHTSIALAMTKGTDLPVIHDCHDWVPDRNAVKIEYLANSMVANSLPDLCIYVSEIQREIVKNVVGDHMAENILIHNYPIRSMIPEETLPKLSAGDPKAKLKIVYAGTVSDSPTSHRYFYNEFMELLKLGHEIYCYAPQYPNLYDKLSRSYRNFHWKGHVKATKLIEEISQYDLGILPFQKTMVNEQHLNSGLPNKLFEYISAGLPVACKAGLVNQEMFIMKEQVGFVYNNMFDFEAQAKKIMGIPIDRFKWVMDDEIREILIPHYQKLKAKRDYFKMEPKELMTKKTFALDCEIFEGFDVEIGLYGVDHGNDLIFESYMAEERKILNETEESPDKESIIEEESEGFIGNPEETE